MSHQGSAGQQPPRGHLRLVIQASQLDSRRESPSVRVDGRPVATVVGENLIEMAPGTHVVDVTASGRTAPARYEVVITEGQMAELWYAPPFARVARGTIGPRPQPDYAMRYLTLVGLIIAVVVVVARQW